MTKSNKVVAMLLALLMIFTSFSVLGSAISFDGDGNLVVQTTDGENAKMTMNVKLFDAEGNELADMSTVTPGDTIKARAYIGANYYTGDSTLVLHYDSEFFATPTETAIVNSANANLKKAYAGVDEDAATVTVSLITNGTTSILISENDWSFEVDFTVKDNASADADGIGAVYMSASEIADENNIDGVAQMPYSEAGLSKYDAYDLIFLSVAGEENHTSVTVNNSVEFNPNFSGATNTTIEGKVGSTYTDEALLPISREGYTFLGWYVNDELAIAADATSFVMPVDKNVVYVAAWDQNVNITFATDGGTEIAPITDVQGGTPWTVAVANPTKDGYEFLGWEGEGVADGALPSNYPVAVDGESDFVYTAKWAYKTTITINANGGTCTGEGSYNYATNNTILAGAAWDTSVVPQYNVTNYAAEGVTRQGYALMGWQVNDGEIIDTFPTEYPEVDTTYTAVWAANNVTVYYFADTTAASAAAVDTSNARTNALRVETALVPFESNYTVSSYGVDEFTVSTWVDAATGTTYTPGQSYKMDSNLVSFNAQGRPNAIYLVASKEQMTEGNEHNAIFNANGGTWSDGTTANKQLPFAEGDAITAPEFELTREGYTFAGWEPALGNMGDHDLPFEAAWTANTVTFTYTVDGAEVETENLTYGDAIDAYTPADPEKEGYTFTGWKYFNGEEEYTGTTVPAFAIEAQAQFTVDEYTLTWAYTLPGETEATETSSTVAYGTTLTAPEAPVVEGYNFTWGEYAETMPAEDYTVTGTFTPVDSSVTFKYTVPGADEETVVTVGGKFGDAVTAPKVEVPTGYDFAWSAEVPETIPAEALDITGIFTIHTNTLKWSYTLPDATEPTVVTIDAVDYNALISDYEPEVAVPEGWEFAWAYDAESDRMPDEELTIYGSFSQNFFKVTYKTGEGVWSDSGLADDKNYSIAFGSEVPVPGVTVVREYYTFAGWRDADGRAPEDYTVMPTKDLEFTAQFERVAVKLIPSSETSTAMIERDGIVETYNTVDPEDYTFGVTAVTAPTTTRIDTENHTWWFVYGLKQAITADEFDSYIAVQGDGHYEIESNEGGYGTGAIIKVIDNVTGSEVERFYVVIFGDINGDTIISTADSAAINRELKYVDWSGSSNKVPYLVKAADLNRDSIVSTADSAIVKRCLKSAAIDQVTCSLS